MNRSLSETRGPSVSSLALAGLAALVALTLGHALGNPSTLGNIVIAAFLAISSAVLIAAFPRPGFYVLAASTMLMIVVIVVGKRGLNAFDLMLGPIVVGSVWAGARRDAIRADALEVGEAHETIRAATARFARAVLLFFGVAALSLIAAPLQGQGSHLAEAGFAWVRAAQGLLMFPLAMWWIRSESRAQRVLDALLVGAFALLIVNAIALGIFQVKRAGMVWFINQPDWPIDSPNEGAATMLMLFVFLLARHATLPRLRNVLGMAAAVSFLVLSGSRSGLFAWIIFGALALRRLRWRYVLVGGLVLAAGLPFVPQEYWSRLSRSLVLQRGSFEAYSIISRFHFMKGALRAFLEHPVLGIGYLRFPLVSEQFTELRVSSAAAHNYYLEIAADMGVVGLAVFTYASIRLFQLGAVVRRLAPKGSLAASLAAFHTPMLIALYAANLTGDNFAGLIPLAQLSLWTALLVRCAHDALPRERSA
jgi:O-antigen ligase